MITIRKNKERGHTKIDWLDSYHSFSFGDYYDPNNIHFGPLRVLNDDTVSPKGGFPTHPHKDMEIVSIVLQGTMAHTDSAGNHGQIRVNDVQRMTAGTGIFHSEYNASDNELLHFCQIWFVPNQRSLTPSYQQIKVDPSLRQNKLHKIVSGGKEEGVIFINQDADLYLADLENGVEVTHNIAAERGIYIYNIDGGLNVQNVELKTGDAAKITDENSINLKAITNTKLLVFDLTKNF